MGVKMSSRMIGGVYHPRARGGAMSDALADARAALARLLRMLALRGAGLLLFVARLRRAAGAVSAIHADDASLNNANGRATSPICWGRWARWRRICCCRLSVLRRWRSWRRLLVWGARALTGKTLRYAMWRLVAWPLGTLTVAAGLGVFPGAGQPARRRWAA